MNPLETKRLVLRKFSPSDCNAMDRVFGDAEVMRYGSGVQTSEWVRDWILSRAEEEPHQPGITLRAVVKKNNQEPIGYCGLSFFPDVNGRSEIELGFRFARAYWGNGYATESALAIRDYAMEQLGLRRLISLIDPKNFASIRVAEKLGMKYVEDVMLDGYSHPDRVYVMERS